MRRARWIAWLPALALALGLPGSAAAISNTETFGGFEFNFNNPGARALGMGGAFTSVADDATAAVSNPAGLVILQRPEVSGEVKFTRYTNRIAAFTNTLSEGLAGVYHGADFDDDVLTPSYFSFVYPTDKVVLTGFVRELVNFESNFRTEGVFLPDNSRNFPVQSTMSLNSLNFGGGVGVNLAKIHPLLPNLGGTIEIAVGTIDSKLQRFGLDGGRILAPPDYSASNVRSTTLVSGTDVSYGFNIGAMWKPIKDLSIGAVYRRGPRFDLQQTLEDGPATPANQRSPRDVFDFTLKVPDVYAAGVSYRLFDRLTLSLDVVRARYSQLLDDFQIIFQSVGQPPSTPNQYQLDDATEIHVGAEYIFFVGSVPLAARVGFYTDPDHKIKFTGPGQFERSSFPGGKDTYHFTLGFGVVPMPGLQFDGALNISENITEFVVSTVFRF
jgi:long-subunit fatty acid transport protein